VVVLHPVKKAKKVYRKKRVKMNVYILIICILSRVMLSQMQKENLD
jgi:hypothetical protein